MSLSSLYEKHTECLQKLAKIEKSFERAENEYFTVSFIERKTHQNAWHRMEVYTNEYKKQYEQCESLLKMNTN